MLSCLRSTNQEGYFLQSPIIMVDPNNDQIDLVHFEFLQANNQTIYNKQTKNFNWPSIL